MGANITIYCLENVTDYLEFERLCHDLMSLEGYSSIEPLGGFSDKGRDAIHVDKSDETTIFAYSVREDWRAKLAEDASKVYKHGHNCDQLVFITTARFTAGERDEAINYIYDDFGWKLELFGVERLRVLLEVQHPQVKALHPHIFPPEFLQFHSRIEASAKRNHVFISFAPEDNALADWLTRKLTAEGYLVWCERFNLLGGETYPKDVDSAIKKQTFRVLGLYSQASLQNPEVMRQRTLALGVGNEHNNDFLIPLNVDGVIQDQLDRVTSSLRFIPFEDWASGLQQLLKKLESIACPKLLPNGKAVAAQAFLERDVLADQAEPLYSNCLQIGRMPEVVHCFQSQKRIPDDRLQELRFEWAYRKVKLGLFLSFHQPPSTIVNQYQLRLVGDKSWRENENIHRISSRNLVSELLRKSLIVKCHERGLQHCSYTNLHYFPTGLVEGDRLKYTRPDGAKTYVNAVGQRKFWRPSESEKYRYYLAPSFYVAQDLFDDFVVLIRIRIRLSDTSGRALSKRTANSRRKHLCKDWWNNDWLNRTFAVCQYLAEDAMIIIGEQKEEQIFINAVPVHMNAPISINESVLDQLSYERSEQLAHQDDGESDEETD
jgi:hypothetical protein